MKTEEGKLKDQTKITDFLKQKALMLVNKQEENDNENV